MKSYIKTLLLASITFAAINNTHAELPTGTEVAANINARNEGIALSRNLKMEMIDRRGKSRIRETKAFRKYYGEEKRTAIFYLSPKNVKDTAFLTYDYSDKSKSDDQWLYLPAMRKVRRISASDRGDSFLGTDFTYEDIKLETRVSMIDYTRETIGEETIDGIHCLVIRSQTVDNQTSKELGIGHRKDYVDDTIWMTRKSIQWDPKGELLKTTHFKDIREVQGIWTAHTIEVENHKTKHRTVFTFSDIQYQDDMADSTFSQQFLKRGL